MTTDVRDPRGMPEEGFHEIQLSGKQLVFLFMATTVVSVVIFLAGVLVGRGVRSAETADAAGADLRPAAEAVEPRVTPPATPPAAEATPTPDDAPAGKAAEPAVAGDYYGRLTSEKPVDETVTAPPAPRAEAEKAPPAREAAPKPASPPERAADPTPATAAPAGGILVQVTALRQRGEAESIARRLTQKGYQAFVVDPQPTGTRLFRVRVGPFSDKAAADAVVKRLAREERFSPWIVR